LIDLYTNGTLKLQAIDETGEVFDKVALHKNLPDENTVLAERLANLRQETDALNQEKDDLTTSIAELVLENEAPLQAQEQRIDELVDQIGDLGIDLEIEQALITTYQSKVDELEAQLNVPVEPSPLSHVLFLFFGLVVGGAVSMLIWKREQ
jgi:chromosome segregation ATPase